MGNSFKKSKIKTMNVLPVYKCKLNANKYFFLYKFKKILKYILKAMRSLLCRKI